jgi:hypothetical protein
MKFVPGTKYKLITDTPQDFHTYIGESSNGSVFENSSGLLYIRNHCLDEYREYKEPIVHTRYIYWVRPKQGGMIFSEISNRMRTAEHYPEYFELLKVDRVTFTEEQS